MSVINQMLQDLEARRSGGGRFEFIESLAPGGAGGWSPGRLWGWGVVLGAAALVLAILWQSDGIALPDPATAAASDVQPSAVAARADESAPAAPANRITGIDWRAGSANTLELVMNLEAAPSEPVKRRPLDNGEIQFVLPDTGLAGSLPPTDDERYFKHYRIAEHEDAVHLHVVPYPEVTVEWMTVDNIGESRHSWILKATLPDTAAAESSPAGAASPSPEKPRAAEASAETAPPSPDKSRAAEAPAETAPPVKSAPSEAPEQAPADTASVKTPSAARRFDDIYQRALSYLSADRLRPAAHELDKALDLKPAFHPARELLAGLYLQTGQETEAFMLLDEGLDMAPEHLAFSRIYAEALIRRGRLEQAMKILSRGDPYAGGDAEFQALYAATAHRLGAHEVAVSRYMRALDMQSQNGAWWMGLAMSLEADGRPESAAGAYAEAMDTGQLNADLSDYVQSRLQALESRR